MVAQLLLFVLFLNVTANETFNVINRANRRSNAQGVRSTTANNQAQTFLGSQSTNGDEELYADKRASYGKALVQLPSGLIDISAFNKLVTAIQLGTSDSFLFIPMGTNPLQRGLVDPQAAFAFCLEGADGWIHNISAAPTLAGAESAGEMVECYWQALLRDVPFNEYDTNALAAAAVTDLNTLSDFKGPKQNGAVTPATLFRGTLQGSLSGPYISQFLYLPVPNGPQTNFSGGPGGTPGIDFQAQNVPTSSLANDFMTTVTEWEFIQQGNFPLRTIMFTTDRIFIRNGRDLGEFVHNDYPQQVATAAALILLNFGSAAFDQNNPYLNNPTQEGFVTYSIPDIINLVSMAVEAGLRAAWYQKWAVHRRLRPEFYGFLVHQQRSGIQDFGLNAQVINSEAVTRTFDTFGTYLLPQAYPEGSPTHPAYPEGHSTGIGAGVTMLKAFFNENFVIPDPLAPNAANDMLVSFTQEVLTVGDELNKLADNIGLGRDHAGVHYRSDAYQGLLLGEAVAISILQDESFTKNINFSGFTLTKFDGTIINIGAKKMAPRLP